LKQLRRTPLPKWGIFLFFEAGPLRRREAGLGAVSDGTNARSQAFLFPFQFRFLPWD
jgi:hypothetical protein